MQYCGRAIWIAAAATIFWMVGAPPLSHCQSPLLPGQNISAGQVQGGSQLGDQPQGGPFPTGPFQTVTSQAAPVQAGPVQAGHLQMMTATLANGVQQIVILDSSQKSLAVYQVEMGNLQLRSVRSLVWDLRMEEFNGLPPLPSELRRVQP